jgi:hypothetical protein
VASSNDGDRLSSQPHNNSGPKAWGH